MVEDLPLRYTRHQTPRGALADAESGDSIYLFKSVSRLRLTYQIRLLAFRAMNERKKLVIRVPLGTEIAEELRSFVKRASQNVRIEEASK